MRIFSGTVSFGKTFPSRPCEPRSRWTAALQSKMQMSLVTGHIDVDLGHLPLPSLLRPWITRGCSRYNRLPQPRLSRPFDGTDKFPGMSRHPDRRLHRSAFLRVWLKNLPGQRALVEVRKRRCRDARQRSWLKGLLVREVESKKDKLDAR